MFRVWPLLALVLRGIEVFETGFIGGEVEKNCFKARGMILDSGMTCVTHNSRFNSATSEHIFLYLLERQIRRRKPNKHKYHIVNGNFQQSVLSHPKQISFNQPSRKSRGVKLVNAIKHLPQNILILWHHH